VELARIRLAHVYPELDHGTLLRHCTQDDTPTPITHKEDPCSSSTLTSISP